MSKYVKLTPEQKEEIRRLTQLANRRIKAAHKQYAKEGLEVAPHTVTGGYQLKDDWEAKNYALSRSVKFTSEKEYQERLKFLKSFDPKASGKNARPTISQFRDIEHGKTTKAIETVLGATVPDEIAAKLEKMNAAQISKFWNEFDNKARRVGTQYSSNAVMSENLREFFPEDMKNFEIDMEAAAQEQQAIQDFINDMNNSRR